MELLVDENIRGTTLERLYADGHDIIEMKRLAPGEPDELVLQRALATGRLLVTADKDFGELVFLGAASTAGVLLVRVPRMKPGERAELISGVIARLGEGLLGAFTTVTESAIRVRPLPSKRD